MPYILTCSNLTTSLWTTLLLSGVNNAMADKSSMTFSSDLHCGSKDMTNRWCSSYKLTPNCAASFNTSSLSSRGRPRLGSCNRKRTIQLAHEQKGISRSTFISLLYILWQKKIHGYDIIIFYWFGYLCLICFFIWLSTLLGIRIRNWSSHYAKAYYT